jgi:hippurate hydrolase
MRLKYLLLAAALAANPVSLIAAVPGLATAVKADYDAHLQALFIDFHKNPELSYMEKRTAGIMAKELRAISGIVVTEGVGGTGVVGVMKNGEGPTVLVRADMDGLPVKEASGVPYASTVRQVGIDGVEVPVMHACGHDVHITSLIGTAHQLAAMKNRWKGTVVFIVQPAEERAGGAKKMLADGLYTRFPKPDYALAFHVAAGAIAGKIIFQPGLIYSSSDSVDILIHGVGAHGAAPNEGKDPVVMGAEIVMALQALVSREIAPLKPAVVTVGSFHSGIKHNIISDRAELQLTVRADDEETRQKLLDGIKRIAVNIGRMNGMSEDKLPEVKVSPDSASPTMNDVALTMRLREAFKANLGKDILYDKPREIMTAEDFSALVQPDLGVPGAYFWVGGTPQADFDAAKAGGPPVPSHHSPLFKIAPEPSIRLGTEAMTVAVLDLLKPKGSAAAGQ